MPKRTDIKKICIIGAGPIVIGQACEFDYSGVQACKALKEEGYEVVLVNSNPATIMTDPVMADHTYIEPLTPEMLAAILRKERPDAILPTLGGQTGLNLGFKVAEMGVLDELGIEMLGANAEVCAGFAGLRFSGRSSQGAGIRRVAVHYSTGVHLGRNRRRRGVQPRRVHERRQRRLGRVHGSRNSY